MTMDSLGLSTMKNAVNCDNYCLLQTPKWTIKILNAYCSFDLNQNWSWRRVYLSIIPQYLHDYSMHHYHWKSCVNLNLVVYFDNAISLFK